MTIASGQPSMPSPSSLSRCSAQPSLTFFHCWISMSFLSLVMGMVLATVAGGTLKDEEWWMMLLVQHEQSVYFEWLWCDFMKDIHDDKLIHREPSTQSRFYTQKPLHRTAFTHRTFTNRSLYTHTQKLTLRSFYREKPFTQSSFYTEKHLKYTEAFTHRRLLHRDAFTHRSLYKGSFYTQRLLHRPCPKINISPLFWLSTIMSCEKVASEVVKAKFYTSFCHCRLTFISSEKVA